MKRSEQKLFLPICLALALGMPLAAKSQLVMERTPASRSHPELREARFVPAAQATFMGNDAEVVGVNANGVAKAYQAHVMAVHHIIQDQLGKMAILATW